MSGISDVCPGQDLAAEGFEEAALNKGAGEREQDGREETMEKERGIRQERKTHQVQLSVEIEVELVHNALKVLVGNPPPLRDSLARLSICEKHNYDFQFVGYRDDFSPIGGVLNNEVCCLEISKK
jgi:hypothetical protein